MYISSSIIFTIFLLSAVLGVAQVEQITNPDLVSKNASRLTLGNTQIQQALEKLQAGEHQLVPGLLHEGIENAPGNLLGRETLAGYYAHILYRYDLAVDILWDGLQYGGAEEVEYLKVLVDAATRGQISSKLLKLNERFFADALAANDQERVILLTYSGAYAYFLLGNLAKAEELLRDSEVLVILDGALLYAEILWARGNIKESLARMEELNRIFPNSPDLLAKLCRYHREAGDYDASRRYGVLLVMQQPSNHISRIQLMHTYRAFDDRISLDREIDTMSWP
jgi:tetratricopeptide (TPR) repeat protein